MLAQSKCRLFKMLQWNFKRVVQELIYPFIHLFLFFLAFRASWVTGDHAQQSEVENTLDRLQMHHRPMFMFEQMVESGAFWFLYCSIETILQHEICSFQYSQIHSILEVQKVNFSPSLLPNMASVHFFYPALFCQVQM